MSRISSDRAASRLLDSAASANFPVSYLPVIRFSAVISRFSAVIHG